ncbi:hypothetical protein JCM10213_006459 [Rhodosporidiobolus nylandii]
MALPLPIFSLRALLTHSAPSTAPAARVAFFSPSPSFPATAAGRPAFFAPARSFATFGRFTPSFSPSSAAAPSPFHGLRSSFRPSSSSSLSSASRPSFTAPPPAAARRGVHTSAVIRALRPYMGRGRASYEQRGWGSSGGGGRGGKSWKQRLDELPPVWIIGGLIGINVSVFLLWNYAQQVAQRFRDASLFRTMTRNFTVSWQNLSQGRIWTLLTSCFSHEGTSHIIVNMFSLWFMGGAAASILGNSGFLTLYLFSGLVSSTFSALFARYIAQNPYYSAHGASGAVFGCASFFACAFPREKFLLFFVLPVPAWLCVGGLFAYDLYGGLMRTGGTTDSMGHVGGAIAGALFFLRKIGRF